MEKKISFDVHTLEERVYEYLRDEIVNLEMKPGDYINIRIIADKIGVSVTPVRYALLRLHNEGLVDTIPRIGFFVAEISEKQVRDLFAIRKSLELLALELGFHHINPQVISELVFALSDALKNIEKTVKLPPYELDYKLHDTIVCSSGNPYIMKTYNQLLMLLRRARNIIRKYLPSNNSKWDEWIKRETSDHFQIAKMIMEGDFNSAVKSLDSHISAACEIICSLVNETLVSGVKK